MSLREKVFQSIASNNQLTSVAYNQAPALKAGEILAYPRTRGAHHFRNILVRRGRGEPHPLSIGDAKILTHLQQDQGDSLLERAPHEIRASQVHQIPASRIARGHTLEGC